MNALIIDDEVEICYLLGNILKQKNFDLTYVNKITDAPKALRLAIPGIIFLDNHLPDGKGIDFIEYIKTNYPSSKVVMISAHDTSKDRQNALRNGADVFLGKPFTKQSIITIIENLFH